MFSVANEAVPSCGAKDRSGEDLETCLDGCFKRNLGIWIKTLLSVDKRTRTWEWAIIQNFSIHKI